MLLTGEVVGWVDWEDVAIGPLMFDVGCAIIGCCYRSQEGEDNLLDTDRLAAFLGAYYTWHDTVTRHCDDTQEGLL